MKTFMRAMLVVLLFVAIGFLALGFWTGSRFNASRDTAPQPVGTAGEASVEKARERGAAIGEKAAVATQKVGETMEEAALTTKIKAKMVLDDLVKARQIDVTTEGSTVTVSGTVASRAEHERALSLVRETAGVSRVVDHLEVR
jgi:hyperosmotically inducible protein